MKLKFSPAPSPNGTNHEKLFLVRLGRKGPAGAYDEELDTAALRVKVGKLLAKHLDGHAYANSIDTMNNLSIRSRHELGAHQADDEDDENDENEADIDSAVERILGFIQGELGGDRARAADLDVAKALVRDQFHQRRLSRDRARRLSRDRARARARDMDRPLPRSGYRRRHRRPAERRSSPPDGERPIVCFRDRFISRSREDQELRRTLLVKCSPLPSIVRRSSSAALIKTAGFMLAPRRYRKRL